jgi:O-antigen/teichoic acid export membrane protein
MTETQNKPCWSLLKIHWRKLFSNDLRGYLVRGTAGFFGLQVVSTGFGLVTNILLARFLGASDYGLYTYLFAWIGLLTVLSMFGMGNLLIREISAFQSKEEWGGLRGLLQWTINRALIFSTLIAFVAMVAGWLLKSYLAPGIFPAAWIALALLPFLACSNLVVAALQGFRRVILSKIPDVFIRAPLFLLMLGFAAIFFPQSLNVFSITVLAGLAVVTAFLLGCWCLYKAVPNDVFRTTSTYPQKKWLYSAFPLLLIVIFYELNARIPTLMLGSLSDTHTVGIYNVANLLSGLVSFIIAAVNVALGPVISSLYASREMARLQGIVTLSARIMFLVGCFLAAFLSLSRNYILDFFGAEFQDAETLLLVLLLGQIVNVAAGSVGTLLLMTGYEKDVVKAVGISTVLVAILNIFFIPLWGGMGAAYATVAGLVLWNGLLIYQVLKRLGIDSTAIGGLSRYRTT